MEATREAARETRWERRSEIGGEGGGVRVSETAMETEWEMRMEAEWAFGKRGGLVSHLSLAHLPAIHLHRRSVVHGAKGHMPHRVRQVEHPALRGQVHPRQAAAV